MEIERELRCEEPIVDEKHRAISRYDYSALYDPLLKKGMEASVNTIIDSAGRYRLSSR